MTSRFGECPSCGTERLYASQSTCSVCGRALPMVQPPRPAAPTPFSQGDMTPAFFEPASGAPAQRHHGPLASWLGLLGLLATLAVLCAGLVLLYPLVARNTGASETNKYSGASIKFEPSKLSCSESAELTVSWRLPASYTAGNVVYLFVDGSTLITTGGRFSELDLIGFEKLADGTWLRQHTYEFTAPCPPGGEFSQGDHVWEMQDSKGHKIASATLTVGP
jgi:hypothetical protein